MANTEISQFQFKGFQILNSHIENIESEKISGSLTLDFSPRGERHVSNNEFKLYLGVKIKDENDVFKVSIEAVGIYSFGPEQEEKTLSNFFYVNAPAILFPYIRAYISTLTTLSGINTVILPTINLTSLCDNLKDNTKEIE